LNWEIIVSAILDKIVKTICFIYYTENEKKSGRQNCLHVVRKSLCIKVYSLWGIIAYQVDSFGPYLPPDVHVVA
jgi:hypothetical protein